MYWSFDNARSKHARAYPREPMNLPYGRAESKRLRGNDLQRAYTIEGRQVTPSDCGPIRVISGFGHIVRAPGRIAIERTTSENRWREFGDDSSSYGPVRVSGDRWHGTESGFVASWLAGSEFAKIATGIIVFFPKNHLLYQGPLPNPTLLNDCDHAKHLEVMAGLEYESSDRTREIDGSTYGIAVLNIIARVPPLGKVVDIPRGQPLGWFHLVAPTTTQHLEALPNIPSTSGLEPEATDDHS